MTAARLFLGLFGLAAVTLLVYAGWIEPDSLRVTQYKISQSSPLLKGLRIAVISDLHAGAPYIEIGRAHV